MKYTELDKDKARDICKKYKKTCTKCPLRRERVDEKGNIKCKFCYYILVDLLEEVQEELDKINEEEIEHLGELEN